MSLITKKISNQENDFLQQIAHWKSEGKKIVFTNGCFDIIHRGHIEYLAQAADLGDILVIGVNSDLSVKKLKGETRPIQDQHSRTLILASLQFVSLVVIFNEETPINLIQKVSPSVLVKGGDYELKNIVGAEFVTNNGGKVITIPFVDGFSSSKIIDSL
ncbi:MAG: glycerol-3-phosphate cytidylyltransferase [Bacteroidetes bacterium GWF2_33_38]|nr:MAG: glycerol-3-phosphate cytidylyltransferase [Bacteroidetes bacterium GWF2_33_38]OFY72955.1 MAG: glycerol-3-phosphate cytidylyltransferase [Bacteroidetes bacterium RIFOXYA12_FULL_33_9]OFY92322.1 MAG: glycerol-3-phosphate cytidylyltransferase [Bacteroidetes bacterium RIFOXYA2_FULL_33_7]